MILELKVLHCRINYVMSKLRIVIPKQFTPALLLNNTQIKPIKIFFAIGYGQFFKSKNIFPVTDFCTAVKIL